MAFKKIQTTKNYELFGRTDENRTVDLRNRSRLKKSLAKHGWLSCFPLVARRERNKLVIKDGQHRLAIAKDLGIPVYWVEEQVDFDIAQVNSSGRSWIPKDYANRFAVAGNKHYQEAIQFSETHGFPIGTTVAMLAGLTSFSNVASKFYDGTFKIVDRNWAEAVAFVYTHLTSMQPLLKNARFLEACMAICRVPNFESKRLIENARRCRDKLINVSTREAYLDVLEAVYNYNRTKLLGLKAAAIMEMRKRSAATKEHHESNGTA
jgi:hypothetical protein